MKTEKQGINVAPSSDEGHYVQGTKQVVMLDEVTESFMVKGSSKLVTENHTTLDMEEDCFITCQVVFNPLAKIYEKSRD